MGIFDLSIFDEFKRMDKRQVVYQFLNFAMIVSSALMIWKGLMVITGSESPIVVVLSGSMEPAFFRGDLLMLTNDVDDPIRAGDITVFKIEGRDIPIVHRVIKVHEKDKDDTKFLTKGDNNMGKFLPTRREKLFLVAGMLGNTGNKSGNALKIIVVWGIQVMGGQF
uniref:Signal peptidase complex catalytic subunit SEC11 n=1 Tax=Meloidogyne incognita TaxID=6306 RepID=A0A914KHV2_MELIC